MNSPRVTAEAGIPPEISTKLEAAVGKLPAQVRSVARAVLRGAEPPSIGEVAGTWTEGEADGEAERSGPAASVKPQRGAAKIRALCGIEGVAALSSKGVDNLSDGLNVIYGENASGKSSIARILQDLGTCHAAGAILPNVFDEEVPAARARVRVSMGEVDQEIEWTHDPDREAPILRLRAYDAKCGDSYVRRGAQATVLPGPAQRVAALTEFLDELKQALSARADELEVACDFDPRDGTQVSIAWRSRDGKRLRELARWTEDDSSRLTVLRQGQGHTDSELETDAHAWNAKVAELRRAKSALEQAEAALDPAIRARFRERADRVQELETELSASQQLGRLDAESLRQLFAVAHRVAPDHLEGAGFCPLCDRNFDELEIETYRERLRRANAEGLVKLEELREQQRLDLHAWTTTLEELRQIDLDDTPSSADWMTSAIARLESLLQSDASDTADLDSFAADELEAAIDHAIERSRTLTALAAYDGDRENELEELLSRERLARDEARGALEQLEKLETAKALRDAAKKLGTRSFTAIQSELVETLLTASYAAELDGCLREFLPHRSLTLKQRGSKGQVQYSLELEGAVAGSKIQQVLSDGERRMAGLAFFLTEAAVLGAGETLVFDDPVCSVDEVRRDRVARRLAQLARDRQVIVITHDLVFVEMLSRYAEKGFRSFQCRRLAATAGIVEPGMDLEVSSEASVKRAKVAAKDLAKFEREAAADPSKVGVYEAQQRMFVIKLRLAVERLVEQKILHDVVRRFGRTVQTRKLRRVRVSDDQLTLVHRLMGEASRETHDSSNALPSSPPDAAYARELVKRLDELLALSGGSKKKG